MKHRSFAERLDYLFRTVHPPGRASYTLQEIADRFVEATGEPISLSYLSALRAGKKTDPKMHFVEGLAAAFRVPVAFFVDDDFADALEGDLKLLAAMRDAGIHRIALRAFEVDERDRETIEEILDSMSRRAARERRAADPT